MRSLALLTTSTGVGIRLSTLSGRSPVRSRLARKLAAAAGANRGLPAGVKGGLAGRRRLAAVVGTSSSSMVP
jgi:hypothetical protein